MFSFTLGTADLKYILGICGKVISQKASRAQLKCVKFEVERGSVSLAATDLESSVFVNLECDSKGTGAVLLNCEQFLMIVSESDCESIEIQVDGTNATVLSGLDEFELPTIPADDFPSIGVDTEGRPKVVVDAAEFSRALRRTMLVAPEASDKQRAWVGMKVHTDGNTLKTAATTGRNLIVCMSKIISTEGNAEFFNGKDTNLIIPNKFADLICKASSEGVSEVALIGVENRMVVVAGNIQVSSLLIQANFPKYQQIMNKEYNKEARFKVEDIQKATRKAAALTNDETKGIVFQFEDEKCTIRSQSSDRGKATVDAKCSYEGAEAIEITLRHDLVTDGAKIAAIGNEENVLIEMVDRATPITWRHKDFIYMIMPIVPENAQA